MSNLVTQIIKEGNNVLLKDASGNILKVLISQLTFAHPSAAPNGNIIQFNDSPDICPGDGSFFIKVDNITTPAGPWTQQTLLQELSDNYINCPQIVDVVVGEELNVKPILADNCSVDNIPGSLTEVELLAVNTLRREVIIHNNTNGTLYILCGSGVTSSNYNWRLKRGDHLTVNSYRGIIKGIFTNATGFAMVSEKYYT